MISQKPEDIFASFGIDLRRGVDNTTHIMSMDGYHRTIPTDTIYECLGNRDVDRLHYMAHQFRREVEDKKYRQRLATIPPWINAMAGNSTADTTNSIITNTKTSNSTSNQALGVPSIPVKKLNKLLLLCN